MLYVLYNLNDLNHFKMYFYELFEVNYYFLENIKNHHIFDSGMISSL